MERETRGSLVLLSAAFIWGTALVAQRAGMDHIGPFAFNAARFLIGAAILAPLLLHFRPRVAVGTERRGGLVAVGTVCGLILFVIASLQQIGIQYTTVGKAGFITALYIVIVPLLERFLSRPVASRVWICIAVATGGMYLLCLDETFVPGRGDTLVLLCAVFTAIHIVLLGRFAPHMDSFRLSCTQFLVCGLVSLLASCVVESTGWNALQAAWLPILYTGVLSCGVAYTLQTMGQKDVSPVIASLILSLESVFSVLAGWSLLGERLSGREIAGCALIFTAILGVQLPEVWRRSRMRPA